GIGRAEHPYRILSVGRLMWKKGHEYGLQAVAELIDQGIFVNYRIIGEGQDRTSILYTIYDLGVQDSVKLLGARPAAEVRAEMARADVLLHPSVSEGFG